MAFSEDSPDGAAPRRLADRLRRLRWHEWAPEIVLIAGMTLFLIDETDAALSSFESSRAIALMSVSTVVWIAARLISWRIVPWPAARVAIFAVAALAALAIVVLPAYDNITVIEAFPGTSIATGPPATAAPADTPTTPPPPTTAPSHGQTETSAPDAAPPAVTVPPSTAPSGPVLLRSGSFEGIDHRAAGTVNVYRNVDGSSVVGLEDIDIQPGPDYDVYVVPGGDRDNTRDGVRLDDLRGNIGTQFYVVPADVDLDTGEWTVLVWCETFGVPIANSTPTEV